MAFEVFRQYVIDVKNQQNDLKHNFYKVKETDIFFVNNLIGLPYELKLFYENIGYGFFYQKTYSSNRILSPMQIKQINLREDFYEYDPDLELYDENSYKNKIIFFEVNEGVYLLIDKTDIEGKNAIYYFDEKIADSLEEFLLRFDNEGHYFE
jgi:hypothetical protein